MPSLFRTITQLAAASWIWWGFNSLNDTALNTFIEDQAGGQYQFLTICGVMLTLVTLVLGACDGLISLVTSNFILFRTLHKTLVLVALPTEATISLIYWPIILIMPGLMLPLSNDQTSSSDPTEPNSLYFIPLTVDLALHAVPALALSFDFFAYERAYRRPISSWGAIVLTCSFAAAYAAWVERCGGINGAFPYPFLTLSNFPSRIAIYIVATALGLASFWGLNGLKQSLERSGAGKGKKI